MFPGASSQGAGAEGTALLEIVHDLAPGARLFFTNLDTSLEFQQAVTWVDANTDVGVDDVGWFTPPYDGTSPASQNTADQLNNDANPVRAYFTALGNAAGFHYAGQYVDSGTDGTAYVGDPGDLHLFQPSATTSDALGLGATLSDVVKLPAGANVVIRPELGTTRSEPPATITTYSSYRSSTGAVVAESIDPQTGTQDPEEWISYVNNTGAEDDFYIVIQNWENLAAPRTFDMFVFSNGCAGPGPVRLAPDQDHNYNTVGGSIVAQGDAGGSPAGVISVGAANWQTPDTLEPFSSQGPTLDGRLKPEVTGIDGVSITGAGDFGTSRYTLAIGTSPCNFLRHLGGGPARRWSGRAAVAGRAVPAGRVTRGPGQRHRAGRLAQPCFEQRGGPWNARPR